MNSQGQFRIQEETQSQNNNRVGDVTQQGDTRCQEGPPESAP